MSFTNIAIIGSNGFIGRHLTQRLQMEPGVSLFLFGKNKTSFFKDTIPYSQVNLCDKHQVNNLFKNIDLVYYLASETIPANSWDNPMLELEKNLSPFIQFVECIAQLKVKKMVFLSSAGTIYGPSKNRISEESDKKPFSPYGIVKLAMENFLNYFQARYQLQHDIYRISNVYGEGQDTTKGLGIINTFIEKIITEQKITIYGDGENLRNYIYVKDVAELLSFSIRTDTSVSNTFNLSSDDTLRINDLVKLMKRVINGTFEVNYVENRQSDNSFIDLDNTKLKNACGDFRFTSIEDGIQKTFTHIKNQLIKS